MSAVPSRMLKNGKKVSTFLLKKFKGFTLSPHINKSKLKVKETITRLYYFFDKTYITRVIVKNLLILHSFKSA